MADDHFPDSFARELSDVSVELKRVGDLADGVARSLTHAFRGAILDGRSLKSVLGEVSRAFAEIALKAALKPVGTLVSGAIESLFTATNPALGGVTPFAKGGVVAQPTYFAAGGGFGVAGEAGAEAILPLARGSDGRLGLAGGGQTINVTFNVTASDARSFAASEAEVSAMLLRAVRRGTRGASRAEAPVQTSAFTVSAAHRRAAEAARWRRMDDLDPATSAAGDESGRRSDSPRRVFIELQGGHVAAEGTEAAEAYRTSPAPGASGARRRVARLGT